MRFKEPSPPRSINFLEPFVEKWSVRRHDLVPTLEMRTVECDEVRVFFKWSGEAFRTALVPAVHQLLLVDHLGRDDFQEPPVILHRAAETRFCGLGCGAVALTDGGFGMRLGMRSWIHAGYGV
jgi:hypothetical protein